MKAYINVRGCNGSGKTTLLRFLAKDPACRVAPVTVPDHKPIPITYCPGGIALLGDYTPAATGTTAGCDRIKTQEAVKLALEAVGRDPAVDVMLFEGVVVSTIFGPWAEWAAGRASAPMWWAFLDTPLALCLQRIQQRNGGKPIKEDQVADKHTTIARVAQKADQAGLPVTYINHQMALSGVRRLMAHITHGEPL